MPPNQVATVNQEHQKIGAASRKGPEVHTFDSMFTLPVSSTATYLPKMAQHVAAALPLHLARPILCSSRSSTQASKHRDTAA